MHFAATTITTTSLLAALSSAASVSVRRSQTSDPHIVDFRTYGAPGCYDENQGVYTYLQSDLDTCFQFADDVVESIFVTDITDGCSVFAYTDASCSENQITVPVGIANCYNSTVSLASFQTVCS